MATCRRVIVIFAFLGSVGVILLGIFFKPNHYTVVHEIAALEADFSATPNMELLDNIVDYVRTDIGDVRDVNITKAIGVLAAIDNSLRNCGFRCGSSTILSESLTTLYSTHLKNINIATDSKSLPVTKKESEQNKNKGELSDCNEQFHFADCDILTYLYLGIGEAMNLPLHAVAAPKHLFIRWDFQNGSYLNWETTIARPLEDAWYVKGMQISKVAIEKGVYLRSMSRSEVIGYAYVSMGIHLAKLGEKRKAMLCFDRAISLCPRSVSAFYNRGILRYNCGLDEQAEADFQKTIYFDPHYAEAYVKRGLIYHHRHDLEKAICDYTAALKIDPRHTVARLNRAAAWHTLGKYDKAIEDYTTVIASNCDSCAYANRAIVFFDLKEYKEATKDYRMAIRLNPNDPDVLNSAAWFFASVPDPNFANPKEAIVLAMAVVQQKTSSEYLDTLATALARAGFFANACKVEEAAIHQVSDTKARPYLEMRLGLFRKQRVYIPN